MVDITSTKKQHRKAFTSKIKMGRKISTGGAGLGPRHILISLMRRLGLGGLTNLAMIATTDRRLHFTLGMI